MLDNEVRRCTVKAILRYIIDGDWNIKEEG
jgi:hypothetical protein